MPGSSRPVITTTGKRAAIDINRFCTSNPVSSGRCKSRSRQSGAWSGRVRKNAWPEAVRVHAQSDRLQKSSQGLAHFRFIIDNGDDPTLGRAGPRRPGIRVGARVGCVKLVCLEARHRQLRKPREAFHPPRFGVADLEVPARRSVEVWGRNRSGPLIPEHLRRTPASVPARVSPAIEARSRCARQLDFGPMPTVVELLVSHLNPP